MLKRSLFCVFVFYLIASLGETRLAGIKRDSRELTTKGPKPKDSDVGTKYRKLFDMHGESLIHFEYNWDFHTHLVQTPRNYSAFVLFNFQSDEDCQICPIARNNLNYIRHFYLLQQDQPAFFFIEVIEEPESSVLRKLQIRTPDLPVLLYVPDYGRLEDVVKMDDQRISFSVRDMANWIYGVTGVRIKIVEETNLQDEYGMKVALTFFSVVYFYKYRSSLVPLLRNDTNVAIIIMALVIYFLSGGMYNVMNGIPFTTNSYSGDILFIHPSSQRQLCAESMIIFVLYCLTTYGMILMGDFVKQPLAHQIEFNFVFYVGMSLFGFAYLFVYAIFGHKLAR